MAPTAQTPQKHYENFLVSIYLPVKIANKFAEPSSWHLVGRRLVQVNVDKVYIESQRSRELANDALLEEVKNSLSVTHA